MSQYIYAVFSSSSLSLFFFLSLFILIFLLSENILYEIFPRCFPGSLHMEDGIVWYMWVVYPHIFTWYFESIDGICCYSLLFFRLHLLKMCVNENTTISAIQHIVQSTDHRHEVYQYWKCLCNWFDVKSH